MEYGYDISRLKQKKMELGLTNSDIADKCKLTQPTVGRVFAGYAFRPPTVKKIAEALGFKLPDLVVEVETLPTLDDIPARPRGNSQRASRQGNPASQKSSQTKPLAVGDKAAAL